MRRTAKITLATIISILALPAHATNNNPASVDYVINYVKSQVANIRSATTYTVGQHALGGTVFYVDSTGTHGLVATNSPIATQQTWNGESNDDHNIIVNATGNGVGAGAMNTSLMVGVQSSAAASRSVTLTSMAAQACVNYAIQDDGITPCGDPGTAGQSCYANWYLPSLYELNQMYLQSSILGPHVDDDFIWSSTEVDQNSAWRLNFNGGTQGSVEKSATSGAWCIHSF